MAVSNNPRDIAEFGNRVQCGQTDPLPEFAIRYSLNLSGMFEPGREMLTFVNQADYLAKIRHYLQHEQERREIAPAGRQ